MANGLKKEGGEAFIRRLFRNDTITYPGSLDVALFNDATDALAYADSVGDITTEPGGSDYGRQTATLDGSDVAVSEDGSGHFYIDIVDQVYNVSDATSTVAHYAVIAGSELYWTGPLDTTYDLGNIDTFTLQDVGIIAAPE